MQQYSAMSKHFYLDSVRSFFGITYIKKTVELCSFWQTSHRQASAAITVTKEHVQKHEEVDNKEILKEKL